MMAKISAYEFLHVSVSATPEEIRQAYLSKAKLYHPDRGGTVEDFLNLKRAYEILSCPNLREILGEQPQLHKPSFRIQPSAKSNIDLLMRNLEAVRDKIVND